MLHKLLITATLGLFGSILASHTPGSEVVHGPNAAFEAEIQSENTGLNIGDIAPDLEFESPEGKTYKLSSLRGKVVLIDFWASWCMPCRRENPNVVNAYKKYGKAKFKDAKGFEIYSVSLDKSKDKWVAAIEQDKLDWKYHVSDLGGWQSEPANIYAVRSIPYSVLIDAEGKILAKNLRGADLHMALDNLISGF